MSTLQQVGVIMPAFEQCHCIRRALAFAGVWEARDQFTFDCHVPALVELFRAVMERP